MAKGGPHFPGIRPDDPAVAAQYIKPFGRFSKVKCDRAIYKTKDVGAMWRDVAGRRVALQVGGCGLGSLQRSFPLTPRKAE
jgi:hypothetical protein